MADESGALVEKNAELLALQRLDEKSVKLQQTGRYMEALECMERALVLRQVNRPPTIILE